MTSAVPLAETKARIEGARLGLASQRINAAAYRELIDGVVGGLATLAGWEGTGCCVAALGGYGRGELAPRSDIDLLFLLARHGKDQPSVEAVLYPLWDLGFEVGHAVRTPLECRDLAREDLTAATALLESRPLRGDGRLLEDARRRSGICPGGSRESRRWVPRILDEVGRRRERFGEISHLLEPHVKEGKGGLRDFQASRWLLECLGREGARGIPSLPRGAEAAEAYGFLFRVRNALHVVAGRKTDHLTFDFHQEVAALASPGASLEAFFEALHLAGHRIAAVWDEAVHAAQAATSRTLPWSRPPAEPSPGEFAAEIEGWCHGGDALSTRSRAALSRLAPEAASATLTPLVGRVLRSRASLAPFLRELHRWGKLGAVLPELDCVIHQVRYDARHAFTTGVHCIEALSVVEDLWLGLFEREEPHLTLVASRLEQPHAVRLAALCHDLGRSVGAEEHAERSSRIGRDVALRLGYSETEAQAVVALIREHHTLPSVALGSDLENPASWQKARRAAAPPASLDGLLALAFCDLSATQPRGGTSAWSDWARDLLLTLCSRADRTDDGSALDRARELALPGVPQREVSQVPRDLLERLLSLAASLGDRASVWDVAFRGKGFVEILGVAQGSPKTLSSAAGVLAALRLDILSVQVHRWRNGTVHLWIRAAAASPPSAEAIMSLLGATASGEQQVPELPRPALRNPRDDAVPVRARVRLADGDDPFHSVLEVECRDRRGLIYDLSRVFEGLGVTVVYALVTTAGPSARDVFHLQDIFGGRIDGEEKSKALLEQVSRVAGAHRTDYDSPRALR